MNDRDTVAGYIDVWREVADDNVAFLRTLGPADWTLPTDLPGWNVRYVAAHLAHLESVLAGNPQAEVDVPDLPHVKGAMNVFTESGPLARADWTTGEIIDELQASVAARHEALLARMPMDPAAPGDGFASLLGWTQGTLLANRVTDQWMHQQDIRRAIGRPGGLGGRGGAHVLGVFSRGLGYVVGKQVRPTAGTSVVIEVAGEHSSTLAVQVGDDGRAHTVEAVPADPTTHISMSFESYVILSGGRRPPAMVEAAIAGDQALGNAVLAALAVTP